MTNTIIPFAPLHKDKKEEETSEPPEYSFEAEQAAAAARKKKQEQERKLQNEQVSISYRLRPNNKPPA